MEIAFSLTRISLSITSEDSLLNVRMSGAYDTTFNGISDIFVAKLDSSGSTLLYSTYLGGSDVEYFVTGIEVDPAGNTYVSGETFSADFPTTAGAYDTTFNG